MIKTRFAPSPTGYLHIGGLKTALFSYLFAKQNNGNFILRIEDTDQARFVEGGIEQIKWSLNWGGLNWDEGPDNGGANGPYIQTQRREIYQKYIKELIDKGFAYHCFCTSERLQAMRDEQTKNNMPPKYDRHCACLSKEEVEKKISNGEKYVVRMKVPDSQVIKFKDAIKGDIEFNSKEVDDQVLMKSDGLPTYHFAVVIDDHFMEVTHIIRADEWVSSTPKQILLYNAFGWEVPVFAHVPPILAPGGKKKLSKREGSVSVNEFYDQGILPEGMINYLALLGWNPGTTEEIFTMDELVKRFDLSKCQKAGAVFDPIRLEWVNGQHIRRMDAEKFRNSLKEYMDLKLVVPVQETFKKFSIVEQERINKLSQFKEDFDILFGFNSEYESIKLLNEKMGADKSTAEIAFSESIKLIDSLDLSGMDNEFNSSDDSKLMELKKVHEEFIKNKFLELVKSLNMKNGQVLWPIRYAISGSDKSPTIFEIIWVLGKEESIKRIQIAMDKLKSL